MDPKYARLPGIVADQPDCYETNDLPEDDQHAQLQEKFESEHIQGVHLSQKDALESFKGKQIDASSIDFSESVSIRRRTGYGTGPTVFEMIGEGSGEPETSEQRYTRLQHEISELGDQLKNLQKESVNEEDAKKVVESLGTADIAALQSQLKQLQLEQILGDESRPVGHITTQKIIDELAQVKSSDKAPKKGSSGKGEGPVTYELYYNPEQNKGEYLNKLSSLEARLQRLETVIEPENMKLDAIQNVASKAQVLDLNNLELLEAKLGTVMTKLDQVGKKEEQLGGDDVLKVNELYDMMKKWDPLCAGLPQLVSRLQSLKTLHDQALQFSQALTQLDAVQQQINQTMETDSALMNEIRSSMTENMKSIQANMESIESRMKALGK